MRDVTIGYVRGEKVHGDFMESLLALHAQDPRIYEVYGRTSGPAVALMRNLIVAHFLFETPQAKWLWFVDTDMTFAPDTVTRLLKAANEYTKPVVGGLCFSADTKGGQIKPTLYTGPMADDVLWDYPRDTMQRVYATGAACLLIHRSALEKLMDNYSPVPWFEDVTMDTAPDVEAGDAERLLRSRMVSEDRTFCHRLHEQGIPLWVHTGVRMGHVKSRPVTEDDYRAARAAA